MLVQKFESFLESYKVLGNKVLFLNFNFEPYSSPEKKGSPVIRGHENTGPLLMEIGKEKGLDVRYCNYSDIIISGKEVYQGKKKLSEYDFVFLGLMAKKEPQVDVIIDYLKANGVSHFTYGTLHSTKLSDMYNLCKEGLPYIPTIVTSNPDEAVNYVASQWNGEYPVVSKVINGSQGIGVEKCDNEEELRKSFKTDNGTHPGNYEFQRMVQKFIPNDCDYRVLIFNGEILATAKRTSQDKEKEFRNNMSLGGSGKIVKLGHDAAQLALDSARVLGKNMAGVDLIQSNEDGKWYIMEVNSSPQYHYFTELTGLDFPDKILNYINSKILGKKVS
jgi:ribosomal protein S6--L-glutamate ligase